MDGDDSPVRDGMAPCAGVTERPSRKPYLWQAAQYLWKDPGIVTAKTNPQLYRQRRDIYI